MAPPDDALSAYMPTAFDEIQEVLEISRSELVRPVGPDRIRVYTHGEGGAVPIRFSSTPKS